MLSWAVSVQHLLCTRQLIHAILECGPHQSMCAALELFQALGLHKKKKSVITAVFRLHSTLFPLGALSSNAYACMKQQCSPCATLEMITIYAGLSCRARCALIELVRNAGSSCWRQTPR